MKKFLYAVLAFTPIIELIASTAALIAGFVMIGSLVLNGVGTNTDLAMVMLWIGIIGIILGIVLCIIATIVFCIHAKKNEALDSSKTAIWIGSLIGLMFLAFPAYWLKCIK